MIGDIKPPTPEVPLEFRLQTTKSGTLNGAIQVQSLCHNCRQQIHGGGGMCGGLPVVELLQLRIGQERLGGLESPRMHPMPSTRHTGCTFCVPARDYARARLYEQIFPCVRACVEHQPCKRPPVFIGTSDMTLHDELWCWCRCLPRDFGKRRVACASRQEIRPQQLLQTMKNSWKNARRKRLPRSRLRALVHY